jgi:hypothetical protein
MYARVARWEGGDAEAIRKSAEDMQSRVDQGPPEGVPSTGFTLLIDPDSGNSIAVGLFETEEDYRKGDETLNSMTPSENGTGKRVSVEKYEVAVDVRLG